MNILDAQEMVEAEKLLLQAQSHHPYIFLLPEPSLIPTLQTFSSTYFPPATRQIQEQTQRIVTNARNIKSVKKEDPNACIKAFTYSVFAIIFPISNSTNRAEKIIINDALLETLKCSLYSKDLNFNHISNKNFSVDNLQAKAMMAKFFHSLIARKQYSNAQKIRYIEWSFEKNQVLQELFILFYRIILAKLYVEGADDYGSSLNFSESITNLIEYFDINYRNFGDLFLISEENYFLASVSNFFVMGQYVENGGFLVKESMKTTDQKGIQDSMDSQKNKVEHNKKNGVVEKDIKLFNFILESGRESHIINDKDADMETPHFKDSHEFAFGKKRKDEEQITRQQELKKEFQKFFMNSQADSVEQGQPEHRITDQISPTYQQLAGIPRKQSQQIQNQPQTYQQQLPQITTHFLKKSTFNQSLIHELQDEISDQPKINPETYHKNIVMVKDKNLTSFSPQITNHLKYQGFSSYVNDGMFLDHEANIDLYKSSSGENAENMFPYIYQCKCMENRKKKNKIASKVVEFAYLQPKTQRSPKFLQNLKYSQNINNNSPKLKPFPKQSLNLKQYPSNKQFRKPSFLKFLKKEKEACNKSCSSKSKSKSKRSIKEVTPSLYKDKSINFELDKQTVNRINNKCTTFSTILIKNQFDSKPKLLSTKSATKRNDSASPTKPVPVHQSMIKNFDSKYLNSRPGLGSIWKFNQNFHHSPKNIERQQQGQPGMIQTSRNENVRVYAPVNIIAPTVYFNGITERDNRVVFTVNGTSGAREREMGLKMSERYLRTETGFQYAHQRMSNLQQRYI